MAARPRELPVTGVERWVRDPYSIYGRYVLRLRPLDPPDAPIEALARGRGHSLVAFQSNAEHELIAKIHSATRDGIAFVIVNPGAYTHTSIALRDAFLGVAVPFIEVHLSNLFARETFRRHSYLSDIAVGCIVGLGPIGYELALDAACTRLSST